jgi:hypothetical protein
MTCQELVQKGWAEHASDAAGVFARLPDALGLVSGPADAAALASLVVHVAGEHLGKYTAGIDLLESLARHATFDDAAPECKAVWRCLAVLHHLAGNTASRRDCAARGRTGTFPEASDEIRILAPAASAFLGQKRMDRALATFEQALQLAAYGPGKDDPAARALAITGNNLACELEGKATRTPEENRLLRQAARAARKYWEIAGTWLEVERAEYRLAMTHLALGEPNQAVEHAEACLAACTAHAADAHERFYANEAVALARHAAGQRAAAKAARDAAAGCIARLSDAETRARLAQTLQALDQRTAK